MLCIELCVSTMEAITLAKDLKIDRVEVCQNLESGGVTPSATLVQLAIDSGLKTHVLIRPRIGGFIYSQDELELIEKEISYFASIGVDGIVIGALLSDHRINYKFIESIRKDYPNLDMTFHKAFDDTPDWKASIDVLAESGVNRILSSGCASNVIKGMTTLKSMIEYAHGKIEILPGGGLNENNMDFFLKNVKPDWIHFSGCKKIYDRSSSIFETERLTFDKERIQKMVKMSKDYSFSIGAISSDI
jgi:copper homeostasis protein